MCVFGKNKMQHDVFVFISALEIENRDRNWKNKETFFSNTSSLLNLPLSCQEVIL